MLQKTQPLKTYFISQIYTPENNQVLEDHQLFIEKVIETSVQAFYQVLLNDPSTQHFFTNELVENHLQKELKIWLLQTLSPKTSKEDSVDLVNKQRQIGDVHARIDVPMQLVNSAMTIIKHTFFDAIQEDKDICVEQKVPLVILISQLMDASLNLINESFLEGHVENQRSAQEFRNRTSAHELAIEIERVKGSLFGWMTQFMADQLSGDGRLWDIEHQEFSLWIRHKLGLICTDQKSISTIQMNLGELQVELSAIQDKNGNRQDLIKKINALASEIGWMLSHIADKHLDKATKEDILTSLIERRFMSPILQNESQLAKKTGNPFSILMIDIDNFKQINDIHGHQAGDRVLQYVGQALKLSLRVTDYAFRYGGEEFLILMPETSLGNATLAADKLLNKIRAIDIQLENNRQIKVTASIGIAEFDGHPDFEHTIKIADEKLYEAKHNGKNRYEF
ncbi:GGDEF domain-containing protein [Thiomicrorhabdus indica]|uniref:GGDEF domain-containing protein n=1 Tax=Thiomicrorhabdus indica TaxID=2267253 RepID=UPI00102DC633|nr:GGDEF domain-containing protein [Thiomicrorhabdus indica]